MENSQQPIYPVDRDRINAEHTGLTKREYFVGLAMQGMLSASNTGDNGFYTPDPKIVSDYCIRVADELLKQLAK